jgi:hypothetical protein
LAEALVYNLMAQVDLSQLPSLSKSKLTRLGRLAIIEPVYPDPTSDSRWKEFEKN